MSIKNFETQIGQIANILSQKVQGELPNNKMINPRESVHAIYLRNKIYLIDTQMDKGDIIKERVESQNYKIVSEATTNGRNVERKDNKKMWEQHNIKSCQPLIPYSKCLKRKYTKRENQFSKFLDAFKKLYINIPFVDFLNEMRNYEKFMKEILTNKRWLKDSKIVNMFAKCSASTK